MAVDRRAGQALDEIVTGVRLVAEREAHHGVFAHHHLSELRVSYSERKHRLQEGRWESPYDLVYRIAGTPRSWKGDLLTAVWPGGWRAWTILIVARWSPITHLPSDG